MNSPHSASDHSSSDHAISDHSSSDHFRGSAKLPNFNRYDSWRRYLLPSLILACIALSGWALTSGPVDIAWWDWVFAPAGEQASAQTSIVLHLRLPRIITALTVGAALGLGGAALQGLFRNPLADPSIVGVSAGASLGAALAITVASSWALPAFAASVMQIGLAFVTALLTTAIVYAVAKPAHNGVGRSVVTMLLAGIAITALVGAATSFLKYLVDNQELRQVSLWQMGSVQPQSWWAVLVLVLVCVFCTLGLLSKAQALNAFLLGESEAAALGVPVAHIKRQVIVLVALVTAATVAVAGVIGFVGLLAPHCVRLLVGPNHRYLLPASAACGALMLLLADALSRLLLPPLILPVGIITALVGAPVFLWLLMFTRGGEQWRQ